MTYEQASRKDPRALSLVRCPLRGHLAFGRRKVRLRRLGDHEAEYTIDNPNLESAVDRATMEFYL